MTISNMTGDFTSGNTENTKKEHEHEVEQERDQSILNDAMIKKINQQKVKQKYRDSLEYEDNTSGILAAIPPQTRKLMEHFVEVSRLTSAIQKTLESGKSSGPTTNNRESPLQNSPDGAEGTVNYMAYGNFYGYKQIAAEGAIRSGHTDSDEGASPHSKTSNQIAGRSGVALDGEHPDIGVSKTPAEISVNVPGQSQSAPQNEGQPRSDRQIQTQTSAQAPDQSQVQPQTSTQAQDPGQIQSQASTQTLDPVQVQSQISTQAKDSTQVQSQSSTQVQAPGQSQANSGRSLHQPTVSGKAGTGPAQFPKPENSSSGSAKSASFTEHGDLKTTESVLIDSGNTESDRADPRMAVGNRQQDQDQAREAVSLIPQMAQPAPVQDGREASVSDTSSAQRNADVMNAIIAEQKNTKPEGINYKLDSWGGDQSVQVTGSSQNGYTVQGSDAQVQQVLRKHADASLAVSLESDDSMDVFVPTSTGTSKGAVMKRVNSTASNT